MPKIKISPLSIIWLMFLIYSKTPYIIPMACAVILHELGHIVCALVLKIKINRFYLSMLGARMECSSEMSYTDEFLLALGGPFAGAFGFAFTFFISVKNMDISFFKDQLLPFSLISLSLSIFNMLPLADLDGGRILKCLLFRFFSFEIATRIIHIISFLALFSLWLLSVYLMIKYDGGVASFVFCSIFFVKCFIFDTKNSDLTSF